MLLINVSKETKFKSDELLALVGDVANYGSFIPWVKAVKIWDKFDENNFKAELLVGYKAFRIPFATQVSINRAHKLVTTDLIKKPTKGLFDFSNQMKSLHCIWEVFDTDDGSRIQLKIEFDFKDAIITAIAKSNLEKAKNKLIEIFLNEADRRFAQK